MTINYQFGDVDAQGALEHQSIVRDVLAVGGFWDGTGSAAC
jgi:hypothetical protein